MADTDIPFINLDGGTPKVDKPVGIKANLKGPDFLDFSSDLSFSNIDLNKYSKYLRPYGGVYPEYGDMDELRAASQGSGEKWLHGILKASGKVGTTFLEPFVDFTYGAMSAVSNGKFSSMFDNDVTQAFDQFNNFLTANLPNYYTKKETLAPVLSPNNWFTANFFSDKLLGGAAFTIGTLLNAYATMGLGAYLKGTQTGLKAGNLAAKTAMANKEVLAKGAKSSIDDLLRTGSLYKFKNSTEALAASLFSVTGEAGLEARDLGKTLQAELARLVEKGEISKEEANERVQDAMATAFAANVAIVGTSQFLQFGKLFQRGYRPNKARLNKIVKDGQKYVQKLPETGFGKFVYATTGARIAVRDMLTEAKEEGLQYMTQKALESKYGEEIMKDNITAISDGFRELFTTKEGQENMLIGALLGTGSHFGKLIGSDKSEPYNKVRQTATGKVVDLLNKHFTKDDNLLNKLVSNAGIQIASTERKEYYLAKDDIFNYKNEEAKEFAAVVKSFADLGALDILKEQIDAFGNMTQEEFNTMINPHKDTEVYKSKEEYIKEIKSKVNKYSRIHQSIEDRFADRFPQYRSNLYFSAIAVENLADREVTIKNEIKDRTGVDYADFAALRSRQYYERAKDKIKKKAGEGEQKEEEKIPTDSKEIFDEAFTNAVNEWLNDHADEVTEQDVEDLTNSVADITNIHNLRQRYIDNYNYMLSEKGQKNTSIEEVTKKAVEQDEKFIKELTDDLTKFKEDKKKDKLNQQDLDKSVSEATQLFQATGNKKYDKIAKELISLMPEDKTLVTEAGEESSLSSSTGDQTKDKSEKKKGIVAKAKQVRNKVVKAKETKIAKAEETKVDELDVEIKKTNVKQETNNAILSAFDKALQLSDEQSDIEDDTEYNSAKRIPVKEENDEVRSIQDEVYDVFKSIFDKNSPISLHGQIDSKLFYDFQFVMKYINGIVSQSGREMTEPIFNIFKGMYQAFVHSTNPNANLYADKLNFTYSQLSNSEFVHDNRYYVTTSKKDSVSTQRAEFSEEGRKHETPTSYYPTIHSQVAVLNRSHKTKNGEFVDIDNNIIKPNNLNYNKVNVGSNLTMRIPESSNYTVDGKIASGAAILNKYHNGELLTLDELRELPVEFITDEGKVIGSLHEESWVKNRIKGDKHNEERINQINKLLQIRALVYSKGSFDTTISLRTNGKLFVRVDSNGKAKQTTAIYTLADPDLQFAIGDEVNAKGELRIAPKKFAESEGVIVIDKSKISPGVTYALLPVNKDQDGNTIFIPAPMQSMRPKDYEHLEDVETSTTTVDLKEFADRVVDTVHSAVEIFLNRDNLSTTQKRIVTALKSNGYDITTNKGLKKYVNNFFYTFDNIYDLDDDKVGGPLRTYLRDSRPGNFVLNISEFYIGIGETGGQDVFLARTYKNGISTHSINVDSNQLNKNNKIDNETFLKALRNNLKNQFLRNDLNHINSNEKFSLPIIADNDLQVVTYDSYNEYMKQTLRSDVMGIYNEDEGMYHYSIQPVIETDTDYISDKENSKLIEKIIKSVNDGQIPNEIAELHKEKSIDVALLNSDIGEWELVSLDETKTLIKATYKRGDITKEVKVKFAGKSQADVEAEIRDALKDKIEVTQRTLEETDKEIRLEERKINIINELIKCVG